jgi:hypothetical protein
MGLYQKETKLLQGGVIPANDRLQPQCTWCCLSRFIEADGSADHFTGVRLLLSAGCT